MRPSAKASVMTAVSTSPAAPMAGSTRLVPTAHTLAGAPPKSQQTMSKSWIAMSRNRPPDTLM
jgi:hypothetical protein